MCSHKKLMRRHQCSYSKCAKLQIIDTDKILSVKIQGKSEQNIGALIQSSESLVKLEPEVLTFIYRLTFRFGSESVRCSVEVGQFLCHRFISLCLLFSQVW